MLDAVQGVAILLLTALVAGLVVATIFGAVALVVSEVYVWLNPLLVPAGMVFAQVTAAGATLWLCLAGVDALITWYRKR